MAVTLTEPAVAEGTVHVSFPILKWEQDEDGDLVIKGVATDGTVDSDEQVVSPEWSAKALDAWISTGGNVRMSHDPRHPVGKGLQVEVNKDGSGKHWVTSVIVDQQAQKLIKKGVLTAYSVGIARPVIKHDPTGKARGGIIVGGELCELSVVDRPSNKNSYLEIAKAAGDGTCEFTGKVFGADAADDDDFVNLDLPRGASISISPADFAKLHTFKQQLVTKAAEAGTEKRDVNTAERRSLAGEGNALPDGSYPIKNTGDLHNAAHLARTGHGNAEAAKKLIARRARELGVANPLDDGDSTSKGTVTDTDAITDSAEKAEAPEAQDAATPDVTKEPEDAAPAAKKAKKPKGGKKKLPPWLNKPADDDGKDGDDDGDADDASKSCKGAHAWIHVGGDSPVPDIRCEKCHTTPAEAAGLSGTHDMNPAPVPDLLESPPMASTKGGPTPQSASGAAEAPTMTPVPQHREPDGAIVEPFEKDAGLPADGQGETPTRMESGMMKSSPEVAAILRFKRAGADTELGRLHDLTCPAFHPDETAKCHPFADLRNVDEGWFQRKAVEAACGPSLEAAKGLHLAWQAARVLKETDPGVLNDFRMEAHKAFRDANPGPTSALTPGMMSPGKYNRPRIAEGHSAPSPGYGPPNTSPQVATNAPDAHSFDRPPLSAGHQSPSPSFMKASFEYPTAGDGPVRLNYAVMEKERARHALMQMHEHLSRQFPEVCPMDLDAPPVQPESRGVPAAVGKSADLGDVAAAAGITVTGANPTWGAAAFKAPVAEEAEFMDAEIWKGFKKQRKKLGKKVLSGSMTVDEARAKLGRQFAQKGAEPVVEEPAAEVEKGLTAAQVENITKGMWSREEALRWLGQDPAPVPADKALDPEVIKAAVAEATTDLKDLLVKQQETFTTRLAEQQKVIDAIADQPDPSTAAFSGLAFNPLRTKAAGPAGVPTQAEIAERTQLMMMRTLQDKINSSSDPFEREAYYGTLAKMRGYSEP